MFLVDTNHLDREEIMLYFALMLCLLPGLPQVQTPPTGPSPEEELLLKLEISLDQTQAPH